MATVDVPVVGNIDKRWLYAGAAVTALIIAVAWWRARNAPATIEDPAGAEYGGELPPDASTTPGLSHTPPDEPDPDELPPTTNSQWTQRAVTYLESIGYDPQLVATTLGKYLGRQPLTGPEADIVRTAEGAIGKPPQGEHRIIPVGTPPGGQPPSPAPPPPVVPQTVSVKLNYDIYRWCAEVAGLYRIAFDINIMRRLNPTIDKHIAWRSNGPGKPKTPYFHGRYGAPRVRIR